MGGLTRLFMRILPIITLICFICFGISYTFETQETGNITYLNKEVITLNDKGTQDTTDDLTIEQYKFDMVSYAENINQDILQRSVERTIDIDAYEETLNKFNEIWDDGYQFLDGIQTITNAVLLVINTIILPINIILVPIRVITGLILTAMSLLGINITANVVIFKALNGIVDYLAIPLINTTWNKNAQGLYNTYLTQFDMSNCYYGYDSTSGYYGNYDMTFNFTSESGGNYRKLFTQQGIEDRINNPGKPSYVKIWYEDTDGYQILVYDNSGNNGGWIYSDARTITITNVDESNQTLVEQLNWYIQLYTTIIRQ